MKTLLRLTIVTFGLAIFTMTVQAQCYSYTTNNGTITITRYNGDPNPDYYDYYTVTIPSTINGLPVTSIGQSAFCGRFRLTSITITDSVTSIGDGAFSLCSSLTSVTIPDSLSTIGDYAFEECGSLTNITIPNSVTNIGSCAFWSCRSLKSINIPDNVRSIGPWAFHGCHSLTSITVGTLNQSYSSVDGVLFDKSQTMLIQCPGGKAGSVSIPNTVTSIEWWAFAGCTNLTDITIPDSVVIIGRESFYGCTGLTNLVIPNNVTNIERYAFVSCSQLASVTIGNNVTSIGDSAFGGCTSLTNVTIGNNVTSIGGDAFRACSSLTSVTIPDSVTSIGEWAFSSCTNLISLKIGKSVSNIGRFGFWACSSLTNVHFLGDAPSVGQNALDWYTRVTVYYVPGTTGWGPMFGGHPTALWVLPYPVILTTAPSFGLQTNRFGFRISWATNVPVVVEASPTLTDPMWSFVSTNTLTDGWFDFRDPEWANYPTRFYRIRSP